MAGENLDPQVLEEKILRLRELGALLGRTVDFDNLKKDAKAVDELLRNWEAMSTELNSDWSHLRDTFKSTVRDLSSYSKISKDIGRDFRNLSEIANKFKLDQQDISRLSRKEIESLLKKQQTSIANLAADKQQLEVKYKNKDLQVEEARAIETGNKETLRELGQLRELQGLFEQNGELKKEDGNYIKASLDATRKRLAEEIKLNETLGLTGKLVSGVTGVLKKFNIDTKDFDDLNDKLRTAAETQSKWNVLSTALKGIWKGTLQSFKDPLIFLGLGVGLLKQLFDIGSAYSTKLAEIRKEYAASTEMSKALYDQNTKILATSANDLATRKSITEAQSALNSEFGTSISFNNELVDGQISLTKKLGFTNEEAAKFGEIAVLNNTNQENLVKTVTKENKGILSNKKVLQEVVKVSGQLATFYGNNPLQIAKAVVQAQKLGMTLEQTKSSTEKLLDFESSIQSQMEAEVLLGQTLNLGRARSLALEGKTADAAEEMLKNVGGLASFQKMNRIQQQAIADAMGMSADELANTLVKQQVLTKLTQEQKTYISQLRKEGKTEIADLLEKKLIQGDEYDLAKERASAQDRFEQSVQRMKDVFTSLVEGPLGKMVEMLANGFSWVSKIISTVADVTGWKNLGSGIAYGAAAVGVAMTLIGTVKTITGLFSKRKPTGTKTDPVNVVIGGGSSTQGGNLFEELAGDSGEIPTPGTPFTPDTSRRTQRGKKGKNKRPGRFTKKPGRGPGRNGISSILNLAGTVAPFAAMALANRGDEGEGEGGGFDFGNAISTISDIMEIKRSMSDIMPSFGNQRVTPETASPFVRRPGAGPRPTAPISQPAPAVTTPRPSFAQPTATPTNNLSSQVAKLKGANPGMTTPQALAQLRGTGGAAQAEVGFLGRIGKGVGGFFKKATQTVSELNPLNKLKGFFKTSGGGFFKKLLKFPVVATLLEGIFANSDIKGMIADPEVKDADLSQAVGKRTLQGLGGVLGGIGGAALGTLIPIPGVGSWIGGLVGDVGGRYLAGLLADAVDVSTIGNTVLKMYSKELTAAGRPTAVSTPELAAGGLVTKEGLAKVDSGEVYLGSSTKETFFQLAKNTDNQTAILKQLSTVFTKELTPLTPSTAVPTITPVEQTNTVDQQAVSREVQKLNASTKTETVSTKESTRTTVESKQTLDELIRVMKEQTSILTAIRDKRLVVEADKLAYATAKATVMSYGNVLNPNSRIR